ncbi:protease modulator HflK N-terminal domain-containing protein, partial [Accumulibacter sp.]
MSLNDPQWGNRGNDGGGGRRPSQGPPDLEQLWRDLNRRLSGIFDRKRADGGGDQGGDRGGDRPPFQFNMRFLGGGIGLLLVLVVVVWLASGFYIVDASQRGVVLQFGRYKESTDPGLRWRLPYPIQAHELVN